MIKDIKIVQWNAAGLINKPEIKQLILKNDYDIACIQETHLKPRHFYNITGYRIIRNDRPDGRGGGVAFIVKNCLDITLTKNF